MGSIADHMQVALMGTGSISDKMAAYWRSARSINIQDFGAVPNGSDVRPALVLACQACIDKNIRRIIFPGAGGATGNNYYALATDYQIPAMPIVHAGAPVASLRMEGDGWGNTLVAGPGSLRSLTPLHMVGMEMSAHVQLDVGGPSQYPHYFEHMEFNSATIFANVASRINLLTCRMQFNAGWAVVNNSPGLHHSIYVENTELSVAYLLGSLNGAFTADEITVMGGKAGLVYPWTGLVDGNGTLASVKTLGCVGISDQIPSIRLANGATLSSGTGAPTIAGAVGDRFMRTDTPGSANQREYICTVAGAAGVATWVGIL